MNLKLCTIQFEQNRIITKPYFGLFRVGVAILALYSVLWIISVVFYVIVYKEFYYSFNRSLTFMAIGIFFCASFFIGGLRSTIIDFEKERIYTTFLFFRRFRLFFDDIEVIVSQNNSFLVIRKSNPYGKPIRISNSDDHDMFKSYILPILEQRIDNKTTNHTDQFGSEERIQKFYTREGYLFKQKKYLTSGYLIYSFLLIMVSIIALFLITLYSFDLSFKTLMISMYVSILLLFFGLNRVTKGKTYFDIYNQVYIKRSLIGEIKTYPFKSFVKLKIANHGIDGLEVLLIFNTPQEPQEAVTLCSNLKKKDADLFIRETEAILNKKVLKKYLIPTGEIDNKNYK